MDNIKKLLGFIVRIFLFWMGLFLVQQIIFYLFTIPELKNISLNQILLGFIYSQRINISAASYLIAVPFILSVTGIMVHRSTLFFRATIFFTSVMLVLVLMIGFFDLGLYSNWGTKLNSKALSFLVYPKEIFEMIFNITHLFYFVLLISLSFAIIWLFRKLIPPPVKIQLPYYQSILILITGLGLMLIFMRGGIQKYPISRSSCYYSKHSVLNYAALNGFWNLANTIASAQIRDNPYQYFNTSEAGQLVTNLFQVTNDTTIAIFKIEKPNIVLIIMESVSADVISCLGGIRGIMPGFDSLANHGLLFTGFYATGFRTDQGIVAVLSSFPAQPAVSILKDFGKFEKLPNLITVMDHLGYHTSFYYGSDLKYANTETYLTSSGIDYLAGINEVPHNRHTDWGAYDEDLFAYFISDSIHRPEPFLTIMLTLTNHEFFDADVEQVFKRGHENDGYLNTVYYTDQCLARFFKEAYTKSWYKNTVFIITSDHAHSFPLGRKYNEPGRHHIPFLIFGEALKPELRGIKIDKPGSQLDISPTLLAQLNGDYSPFIYGKNLFNPYTKGGAYYSFDNGFGFISSECQVVYDHILGKSVHCFGSVDSNCCTETEKQGKAFLQMVFQKYIEL